MSTSSRVHWVGTGLALFLLGCGGGEAATTGSGGSGGDAGVPYSIKPVLARMTAESVADHEAPVIANAKYFGIELAVWSVQRSDETAGLLFSVFDGTTWSPEGLVADIQPRARASIATDGTTFMVAYPRDGHDYARRYTPASGFWDREVQLDQSGGVPTSPILTPVLASNGTGYAAAWRVSDVHPIPYTLYASVYLDGNWSAPTKIGDTPDMDTDGVSLASNGSGYALAFTTSSIHVSKYDGATWQAPVPIEQNPFTSSLPRIASNGSGYAVAWMDGSKAIYVDVESAGTWSGPKLKTPGGSTPLIVGSSSGYLASWEETGAQGAELYADVHAGGVWLGKALIGAANNWSPGIASNGSGYAAAYARDDGAAKNIHILTYDGMGWLVDKLIDTGDGAVDAIRLAGGAQYSLAYSSEDAASTHVYASRKDQADWTAPVNLALHDNYGDSLEPVLAADTEGNRLAVWWQYQRGQPLPYASDFRGGSWGNSALIGSSSDAPGSAMHLAFDGSRFVAVWADGKKPTNVAANSYEAGTWSGPVLLDTGVGEVTALATASGHDSVMAVWTQSGINTLMLVSNLLVDGSWQGATPIASADSAFDSLYVAAAHDRYAVCWVQNQRIMASLSDASNWAPAQQIDNGIGSTWAPILATDGSGYAAVWSQNYGAGNSLGAAVFSTAGWSTPTLLASSETDHKLSSDGEGYVAAWKDGGSPPKLHASVYADGEWGADTALTVGSNPIWEFQLASHAGDHLAVIRQWDGSVVSLYANVYAHGAWSGPVLLETSAGAIRNGVRAISNSSGFAVVWTQDNAGTNNVFANVYNGVWSGATRLETGAKPAYGSPHLVPCLDRFCAAWAEAEADTGVNKIWTAAF